jgi:hypothetical protein
MKKYFMTMQMFALLFDFLFLVDTSNTIAQTDIPAGNVSGLWTEANSPYRVNGEITIPNGETLTIEPGVNVVFTGHYKFNVKGRLLAIGTRQDTIRFTAQDTTTGWHGIRFINTPNTNDSSKIVYCSLKYGKANVGSGYDRLGGAILAYGFSKLLISNCLISFNINSGTLENAGGAICIISCSPTIENNIISHNMAVGNHGGAICIENGIPVIKNNVICKYHATCGGGFFLYSCNSAFINNTIVDNHADLPGAAVCQGGAACIYECSPWFFNTILFGNTATVGNQVNLQSGSQPNFRFCDIEGGINSFSRDLVNGGSFSGIYESNIETDPLFLDAASDDYHLSANSPCIGAGSDSIMIHKTRWYRAPRSDNDGNVRPNPVGSKPDIGAFESPLDVPLTSISEGLRQLLNGFQLCQNFPNPFNPSTSIQYVVGSMEFVTLKVCDILGNEVATLVNEEKPAGSYEVVWNAQGLSSGVYFYQLKAGGFVETKKMILMK